MALSFEKSRCIILPRVPFCTFSPNIAFHWLTSDYIQLASGFMRLAAAGRRRNIVHFHCLFSNALESIVGHTFEVHVLLLRLRVGVKVNFRPYIQQYTSPNENFE